MKKMKKIVIFILVIIILTAMFTVVSMIKPNISRTCNIEKYNVSLKIPYAYANVENDSENALLSLYNEADGISINAIDLKEDFWTSGDTASRIEEYINIMSAANYDSEVKSVETQIIAEAENKIGKVKLDLEKVNSNSKIISLVTNEEIGNVVIEMSGPVQSMENKAEEIEKIIKSMKIKK